MAYEKIKKLQKWNFQGVLQASNQTLKLYIKLTNSLKP